MSERLLQVSGLRSGFGPTTVLHGVDLHVDAGEVVSLLGLNGAGKSVTMKVIGGLVPAWGGSVLLDGEDLTGLSPEARVERGMAHVPQGRQLFRELTVQENLRLGAYLVRRRNAAAYATLLDRVYDRFPRLAERRDQRAGTLSGGEQAMLAVGRALMSEPKLLLVDEPTAGLAPTVVDVLAKLLAEVNAGGVTMLLIEQHVPFALRVGHRALVMQRGRVVHESPTDSVDTESLARHLGIGRLLKGVERATVVATPVAATNGSTPKAPAPKRAKPPAATAKAAPAKPASKPSKPSKPALKKPVKVQPVAVPSRPKPAPKVVVANSRPKPPLVIAKERRG